MDGLPFFEIRYPAGEVKYLGEYLYSLCYSPDGKYAAYSSVDYDDGVDMELGARTFMWIEKDAFGKYMENVR